jgi:uncharacterized protein (TIGR02598 family)
MKILRASRAGFSLIEVTLALGIAAFCLLTVFGLLPLGLNSNQNAFEQTAAAGIATAIASDLHGTPVASTASVTSTTSRFEFVIPVAGKNTVPSGSTFQTLYFSQDATPTNINTGTGSGVGAAAVSSTPPSRYRATVTFLPEDSPAQSPATPRNKIFKVWILITWPALADPSPTAFPSNFAGSYETITTLNCNYPHP